MKYAYHNHQRVTKDAFIGFTGFIVLVVLLYLVSILYPDVITLSNDTLTRTSLSSSSYRQLTTHFHGNYSFKSCNDLTKISLPPDGYDSQLKQQCDFAHHCDDGIGILIPYFYCSEVFSTNMLLLLTSPLLCFYTVLLFRIVASTAEDFFSPALEYFSCKMGLPCRFAGVTLLALGNGAPDIASTVSAMRHDRSSGYLMALGELTGSGMFIATVIVGLLIIISGSVSCRSAVIGDAIMYFITLSIVLYQLQKGVIHKSTIHTFFHLYMVYVIIVLVYDIYHHHMNGVNLSSVDNEEDDSNITKTNVKSPSSSDLSMLLNEKTNLLNGNSHQKKSTKDNDNTLKTTVQQFNVAKSPWKKLIHKYSIYSSPIFNHQENYEDIKQRKQDTANGSSEPFIVVHPHLGEVVKFPINGKPSLLHDSALQLQQPKSKGILDLTSSIHHDNDDDQNDCKISYSSCWQDAIMDGIQELYDRVLFFQEDIFMNDNCNLLDKTLLIAELPITIFRELTVPVPCDGYYCRPVLTVSLIMSPFWMIYYLNSEFGIDVTADKRLFNYFLLITCISILLAVSIFRFGPKGSGPLPLIISAPLSLYGFAIGSSWIDFVAAKLVDVLSFIGILCHVPPPIMGLSVLAVGNCFGDLSANVAVARKGLSNMAITACFAGPVLSLLVGCGLGFSAHLKLTGRTSMHLHMTPPLVAGFIFSMIACVIIVLCGFCFGQGTLRKNHGYVLLILYIIYAITSICI